MNVMVLGGATRTTMRIRAPMRPASSARPTPTIATRMTPTAVKLMKLRTVEVNKKRMPSAVSRLFAVVVCVTSWCVCGSMI